MSKNTTRNLALGGMFLLLGGLVLLGRSKKGSAAQTDTSDGGADRGGSGGEPTQVDLQRAGEVLYDQLVKCYEGGQISDKWLNTIPGYAGAVGQAVACLVEYYSEIGIDINSLPANQKDTVNEVIAQVTGQFVTSLQETGGVPSRTEWINGWMRSYAAAGPILFPTYLVTRAAARWAFGG